MKLSRRQWQAQAGAAAAAVTATAVRTFGATAAAAVERKYLVDEWRVDTPGRRQQQQGRRQLKTQVVLREDETGVFLWFRALLKK